MCLHKVPGLLDTVLKETGQQSGRVSVCQQQMEVHGARARQTHHSSSRQGGLLPAYALQEWGLVAGGGGGDCPGGQDSLMFWEE